MLDKIRFLATISAIDPTEEKGIPGKEELARDIVPNLTIQISRGSAGAKCTS